MSRRDKEESRKGNGLLKIGIVIIVILVLIVLSGVIWYKISTSPVNKNDNKEIEVIIPYGTGTSGVAKILKDNNIIKNESAFKIYAKLNNVSDLQAGTYRLKPSMELKDITETLKTGKMYDPNQMNITYIEGKHIDWLAKLIEDKTNNSKEDVYTLLEDEEYIDSLIEEYWFLDEEIKNKDIYYPLEGYLFPDTYTVANEDITVKELFKLMLNRTDTILSKYKEDIIDSDYSAHEILTIASIIEMESMNDEGRKGVASVIYNRLDKNMAIQSDVTTYYAFKIDMAERDLYQREIDTYNPYNTRGPNMAGKLPIGPISSCSKASIEAAIYPEESNNLFFVADKNGKLYFTKTDSEHAQKIRELREQGLWHEYE